MWRIHVNNEGVPDVPGATLAVLMDIRDELKTMNSRLSIFSNIGPTMRTIRAYLGQLQRKKD